MVGQLELQVGGVSSGRESQQLRPCHDGPSHRELQKKSALTPGVGRLAGGETNPSFIAPLLVRLRQPSDPLPRPERVLNFTILYLGQILKVKKLSCRRSNKNMVG
jgi:hypothetical protein